MAKFNHIKNYTAQDIERYHKGEMTSAERHALEKAALDDPFLSDALEGYTVAGVNAMDDLAYLRQQIAERTDDRKVVVMTPPRASRFPWMRVAAAVILIAGAGALIFNFTRNDNTGSIASNENQATVQSPPDTSGTTNGNLQSEKETAEQSTTGNQGVTTSTPKVSRQKNTSAKPDAAFNNDDQITSGNKEITAVTTPAVQNTEEERKSETADKAKRTAEKDESRNMAARAPNDANNRYSQLNVFRGRVLDNENRAVPFANVTNLRDNVGTYTDAKGNFNLISADTVLDVQVRGLGYNENIQKLRNDVADNVVVMQEDRNVTEEVMSSRKPNTRARYSSESRVEKAEPLDGWEKYDSYLANNVVIPEEFRSKQKSAGEVEVSFEVNANGEPENFKIEKSLCEKCDAEAIRLVKEGPRFRRNARKGRTKVTISF